MSQVIWDFWKNIFPFLPVIQREKIAQNITYHADTIHKNLVLKKNLKASLSIWIENGDEHSYILLNLQTLFANGRYPFANNV